LLSSLVEGEKAIQDDVQQNAPTNPEYIIYEVSGIIPVDVAPEPRVTFLPRIGK